MKLNFFLAMVAVLSATCGVSLWAEDWTTTDGKVYQNVTVVKSEFDAITILYRDGGALVPLAKLPPDLQKRFNYDPVQAKAAADARAQADAKSAIALRAEIEETKKKRKVLARAAQNQNVAKTGPLSDKDSQTSPFQSDQNDPNHHKDLGYPFEGHP